MTRPAGEQPAPAEKDLHVEAVAARDKLAAELAGEKHPGATEWVGIRSPPDSLRPEQVEAADLAVRMGTAMPTLAVLEMRSYVL